MKRYRWDIPTYPKRQSLIPRLPREAVVRRVRELARRVGSALAANGVGAASR